MTTQNMSKQLTKSEKLKMTLKDKKHIFYSIITAAIVSGCSQPADPAAEISTQYDVIIRNGMVIDGSGEPARRLDVAIRGDRIEALLPAGNSASAKNIIDAKGQTVAPGFINVLSWAPESLIVDGRGMSDTLQGVTLEIFGEGWSMGPLNPAMKAEMLKQQSDFKFPIEWTTLGEYMTYLEKRGITPNVASFVGATTVRMHELGEADVAPDAQQLIRMQDLVRQSMHEGALGVGASLIYAPAFYAKPDELVALSKAAAESGGGYVAHMRNESYAIGDAVDELINVARATGQRAEAYHLKAAGESNWPNMAVAIAKIEAARQQGLLVSANMYTYTAGATGLDASMPLWVQEDGLDAWVARLKDPKQRARVIADMRKPPAGEENLYQMAGSTERVKFIGFKTEKLKPLTGKTLAEVMAMRGTSAEDTMIDLVIEDHSRVDTVYFLMSEPNVALGLKQPWVSLGSDAESSAPEGVFLKSSTHPRAYGNFARLLAKYVRDEKVLTLEEAVRRMTRLPAENWKLKQRGCLDPQCFADVVIFDPNTIQDHATFDQPMQYATGVSNVFVNGIQVVKDGAHTGAKPGRFVRGPGWVP